MNKHTQSHQQTGEASSEMAQLLETMLDHTHISVAYLNPQFNFIRVNNAYAKADEREPSFFPGRNYFDLHPSAENEAIFRRVVEVGEPYFASARPFEDVEHPGREGRYWDWSLVPTQGPSGAVTGLVLTLVDVTEQVQQAQQEIAERKRAEEALRGSEQRYRAVVEYQTDLICRFLPDGTLTFVNETYCRYFGRKREELIGHSFLPLILDEDRERTAKHLASFSQRKPVATIERRVVAAGGKVRWQHWIDRPIFDEQGYLIEFQSVGRDVTERKQAEEAQVRLLAQIQEQAQRVQQIIDTVPEGVLLLDDDRQIILANPAAEQNLVVLADASVGDTLTHLGNRPLTALLTSPPKGLWHEVTTDSQIFQVIARPMEAGPEPQGWVLAIRDVTKEREIQRRVRRQERLAAVGQLAAGIAHDFNNIIATIILYAQMFSRSEHLSPQGREQLATIDQQAKHATRLIQQILDFSRQSVPERQPVDLLILLKEQIRLLERTLPENIEIELAYDEGDHATLFMVNADPTRIQQALMNLAVNARDAMPQGGRLYIGLERIQIAERKRAPLPEMKTGAWVRITVADAGMGIVPDALPHIFDPFFTTKAPGEGTGLGLTQVHGIVEQHEGHVDVTSAVGEGTTFILYLPALPVDQPDILTQGLEGLGQGRGEMILVAEDDTATRKALVVSLEALGYRVLEATNGREALALFERHAGQVALVLSDTVMPKMGGQALFQALRERDPAIKVVLLTGHARLERELEHLQDEGLSGWLHKPLDMEQLAEVVAQALGIDRR